MDSTTRVLSTDDFKQMKELVDRSTVNPYSSLSVEAFREAKGKFGCGNCSPHNDCDFPYCVKLIKGK